LKIKIICIWLWYMIWIFSLSKGGMNCWDLIISVVPLAQVWMIIFLMRLIHSLLMFLNLGHCLSNWYLS
jgi:hypothetical protein